MDLLIEAAVRATLIAGAVGLALHAGRVTAPKLMHGAWVSVAVAMLLQPAFVMWAPRATIPIAMATRPSHTVPGLEQNPTSAAVVTPRVATPVPVTTDSPAPLWAIDWWNVAAITYLLGVIVLLGRVALGVWQARRLLAAAVPVGNHLVHPRGVVPLTFGLLTSRVVLPADWTTWDARELAAVLAHEEAHVRRRDPLIALVTLINRAIFWFHPLAWWLHRHACELAEQACDASVLEHGHDATVYSESLVRFARRALTSRGRIQPLAMTMPGSSLPSRLERIADAAHAVPVSRVRRLMTGAMCLAAIVTGSVTMPVAAQTPGLPNVTFDVASIRRNTVAEDQHAVFPVVTMYPARAQTLRGGRLRGRGMSVNDLIRDAYGYRYRPQSDIVGAPQWIVNERYDVEAKASENLPPSTSAGLPVAAQAALRALLAERFNLRVRLELQRRPVYELVMRRADRRLGPNLKPSKGGCRPYFQREPINSGLVIDSPADGEPELRPCQASSAYWSVTVENMTLAEFALIYQVRAHVNRTVIDRTGLTGRYDIRTQADHEPDELMVPFKPVLESQLGLTVRDAEAPVEVLVIEHIDHPTEN